MKMSPIRDKMRSGLVVIAALVVLTVADFTVALTIDRGRFAILSLVAVIEAWLILDYFMHVARVWRPGE
jgi:heme/copper-type cytochrome/quinol oxidase subunit 4